MFKNILEVIDGILLNFSWRRLASIIVLLFFIFLVIYIFEIHTSYFRLTKLGRAAAILSSLDKLAESQHLQTDESLRAIHSALISELANIVHRRGLVDVAKSMFWRFLAGSVLWLVFAIGHLPFVRWADRDSVDNIRGILLLGAIFGFLGLFIPVVWWPWGNFVVYPIGTVVLVVTVALIWDRRQQGSST